MKGQHAFAFLLIAVSLAALAGSRIPIIQVTHTYDSFETFSARTETHYFVTESTSTSTWYIYYIYNSIGMVYVGPTSTVTLPGIEPYFFCPYVCTVTVTDSVVSTHTSISTSFSTSPAETNTLTFVNTAKVGYFSGTNGVVIFFVVIAILVAGVGLLFRRLTEIDAKRVPPTSNST